MLVLPVVSVQVYNGPPCVSISACPTVPESAKDALLVAGFVDIFTGLGAIVTASMLKIRSVRRSAYYGWPLISLAVIHMSSLTTSTLLSPTNTGVSSLAILYFPSPLLVLASGWLLVEKKPKV
jgi:drug/metabolite transporter (DMT)-like permease